MGGSRLEGEMRNRNGVRKDARVVVACALIALLGAKAFAEEAGDATWYFGYKQVECDGAPYLATSNLGTIRREATRGALRSQRTGRHGDMVEILRGERPVPNPGPCENSPLMPAPSAAPASLVPEIAAARAAALAHLERLDEEALAVLAARAAELRDALRAAADGRVDEPGTVRAALEAVEDAHARFEAGAREPEEFVGYADDKCENPVETTEDMAEIVELAHAGDVRGVKANGWPCMKIAPAGG